MKLYEIQVRDENGEYSSVSVSGTDTWYTRAEARAAMSEYKSKIPFRIKMRIIKI